MDNVIIYDKLEELNEGIEYNGGGITSLLGKGCVKSVQRGCAEISLVASSGKTVSKKINISSVDLSKSVLLIYGEHDMYSSTDIDYVDRTLSLSETSINLSLKSGSSNKLWTLSTFFWQVVEFY